MPENAPPPSGSPPGRRAAAEIAAAAFLPGLLAGTQIAGLLFFLNPDLPFSPGPVLRGIGIYGALLGLGSTAVLVPLTRRHRRARRLLPWSLTAVLAAAAAGDWLHASLFAFFLPPGINTRLIKAALWLSLAALVAFYTALLHTLHRRPYGWRSQVGLTLIALASVYVMVERREAFRPRPEPAPRPPVVEFEPRPVLCVVGLEAATLDAILPLAEQGRLPFFAKLLRQGVYGRLGTFSPIREPALWTSLATGRLPYEHGLLGERIYPAGFLAPGAEMRLLPTGLAFPLWGSFGTRPRPTDARDRRALAIWEILGRLEIPTGVLGWPKSAPVSPEAAVAFSDRFFAGSFGPGTAAPSELAERGILFQIDPDGIDPELRGRLAGGAPEGILEILAGDLWRESLALFLLEQRSELEAMLLVLPGLGRVSHHYFGGYSAVQFEGAQEPSYQVAAQLLTTYYQHLDAFLAELWHREARRPRLLAVVSAYGVEPPGRWRQFWNELARRQSLAGSFEEAPDGALLLAGDGIRPGSFLAGADLIDVVPTLLYGLGLPVARDLDGQVLTAAFESSFLARHPLTYLPSYEAIAGPPRGGTPSP